MWRFTSRWVSELQSLIRVFGFDVSNLSGLKTVFDTDSSCVFLGSLVSKHRAGLLLMSRYIPVLTLVPGAENNMWFLSTTVAALISTCREDILFTVHCQDRLIALWQGDLAAGCCKELPVMLSEWIALLIRSYSLLRQTRCCADEKDRLQPIPFCMLDNLLFLGCPLSSLPLCSNKMSASKEYLERTKGEKK